MLTPGLGWFECILCYRPDDNLEINKNILLFIVIGWKHTNLSLFFNNFALQCKLTLVLSKFFHSCNNVLSNHMKANGQLRIYILMIFGNSFKFHLSIGLDHSPVPIYTPEWRDALWKLSLLPKNTTQCSWTRLENGSLDPEANALNHEANVPPQKKLSNAV